MIHQSINTNYKRNMNTNRRRVLQSYTIRIYEEEISNKIRDLKKRYNISGIISEYLKQVSEEELLTNNKIDKYRYSIRKDKNNEEMYCM